MIDVKSYLEINTTDRYDTISNGCGFIFAMLCGGALHLVSVRSTCRAQFATKKSYSFDLNLMLTIAWAPIAIALACYVMFFYGRDYVSIHSNVPLVANILLKTIYFSYPATYFLASTLFVAEYKRDRYLLQLLVGHIFVFAILYMLRSPAIFFSLVIFFLIGWKVSRRNVFFLALITPLALSGIALSRDPTLLDGNLQQSILVLIVTFGDFVDALRFAHEYVSSNGILWGSGILNGFVGIGEPLANIYAKSINEEYFESGGGFGFFILADIYANFGYFGGIIFSVVFGYIFSKFAASNIGTLKSYLSCVFFASSLALTRNDFGSTMRGVFYCVVAYFFVRLAIRIRNV